MVSFAALCHNVRQQIMRRRAHMRREFYICDPLRCILYTSILVLPIVVEMINKSSLLFVCDACFGVREPRGSHNELDSPVTDYCERWRRCNRCHKLHEYKWNEINQSTWYANVPHIAYTRYILRPSLQALLFLQRSFRVDIMTTFRRLGRKFIWRGFSLFIIIVISLKIMNNTTRNIETVLWRRRSHKMRRLNDISAQPWCRKGQIASHFTRHLVRRSRQTHSKVNLAMSN